MYEDLQKMIPKIAIFDQNTIRIRLLGKIIIIDILNGMFWNVFSPKMIVRQNNELPWKPTFQKLEFC